MYSPGSEFATLAKQYNARLTDTLSIEGIDVLYFAGLTIFDYTGVYHHLKAGIHVILDTPVHPRTDHFMSLIEYAEFKNLFLLEGFDYWYSSSFRVLARALPRLGPIYGVNLTSTGLSAAEECDEGSTIPDIMRSNLVDLGAHCISFATTLLGPPTAQTYSAHRSQAGIDTGGTLILSYPDFVVQINQSKRYRSFLPSEIYGPNGTSLVEGVHGFADIWKVRFWDRSKARLETVTWEHPEKNPCLRLKVDVLADIILSKDWTRANEVEDGNKLVSDVVLDLKSRFASAEKASL